MPWIREILGLENDDAMVINYWLDNGIDNTRTLEDINLSKAYSICFGAGPSLDEFSNLIEDVDLSKVNLICADGATMKLVDLGIKPNVVLTDLDGLKPPSIKSLIEDGIDIFVLAHGDNVHLVERLQYELSPDSIEKVIWCTQGRIQGNWINTLGFTDGDRSASLAVKMGTIPILIGYDLKSGTIGKYSKPPYLASRKIDKFKKKKLYIAWKVIQWLDYNFKVMSIDYTKTPGIEIDIKQLALGKQKY